MDDARARAGQLDRQGGQFQDGEFFGITQIDWADHLIRRIDEPHQAIDQINVTERAGLQAIAEYRDVAAEQAWTIKFETTRPSLGCMRGP